MFHLGIYLLFLRILFTAQYKNHQQIVNGSAKNGENSSSRMVPLVLV